MNQAAADARWRAGLVSSPLRNPGSAVESLLIGIVVAVVVWLMMRHGRAVRERRIDAARREEAARTMPRLGTPGTVTPEQLERMKALDFEPSAHWSREEADLILDAVAYLREVLRLEGRADASVNVQNRLLVLILGDAELRGRVMAWGAERRGGAEAPVRRDAHFERVAAAL